MLTCMCDIVIFEYVTVKSLLCIRNLTLSQYGLHWPDDTHTNISRNWRFFAMYTNSKIMNLCAIKNIGTNPGKTQIWFQQKIINKYVILPHRSVIKWPKFDCSLVLICQTWEVYYIGAYIHGDYILQKLSMTWSGFRISRSNFVVVASLKILSQRGQAISWTFWRSSDLLPYCFIPLGTNITSVHISEDFHAFTS